MTNDVDKNTAVQSNALIEIETQTGQVDTLYQSYSSQEVAYEKGASCAFFLGITETGFLVKKITIGDSPEIQYHDVYEIPFGTDKEVPVLSYKTGEMQSAAYSGGLAYIKNNVDSYEFGYIDTQTLEQHILCPDLKKIAVPYTFDDLFVRRFIGEWAIINSMNSITVESNRDLELTYKCYAINMRTSEIKEIRLSNHYNATTRPLEVYACFDDKLLVDAQVKEEKSDDGMMNRITTTLGIISVEDYLSSIANYSLINAEK